MGLKRKPRPPLAIAFTYEDQNPQMGTSMAGLFTFLLRSEIVLVASTATIIKLFAFVLLWIVEITHERVTATPGGRWHCAD